jgi:hypothetical protein
MGQSAGDRPYLARVGSGRAVGPALARGLFVVLALACAPRASVDRGLLVEDAGRDLSGRPDGQLPDRAPDLQPDAAPQPAPDAAADTTPDGTPPDAEPPDADEVPFEVTPPRTVLMVVGNAAMPTGSDTRLQQLLLVRGLRVRLASDEDPVVVTGIDVVVLAESAVSFLVADRYRNVAVPVVTLDRVLFQYMGMTSTGGTDYGSTIATDLTVLLPEHGLAGGLSGTVSVVSASANLAWGVPAPSAERVAILSGMPDRVAVFGYPQGATMVTGTAVARRVGCFVTEQAALLLDDDGVRLLSAAIDWALE